MNSTVAVPFDPREDSPYNYVPTLYVCAIFVSLFAITTRMFFHFKQICSSTDFHIRSTSSLPGRSIPTMVAHWYNGGMRPW